MTFKVNAVLDGRFKPDPFRLPYGPVRAGGAVHVFDTDKFIAALNASGKSAAIFLLGGYPVQSFFVANALDPGSVFQNLLDLFPGALLGDASVIPTGPIDGTQLSFPLTTDFIVVGQGKRFTVMFDVATSAQAQTAGGQTGGGSADFFNTLQPGPIFFTDTNGNRATGITAVGASPAPPLSATGLSLTPVTAHTRWARLTP